MIVATVAGHLAFATRGARGSCPSCCETVIAKAGQIIAPHWAHRPETPCIFADHGGETPWHAGWKLRCTDLARVEVIRGNHRADVVNRAGWAIEFQHSGIDPADVTARERHWRRGVWVLDSTHLDDERLELRVHPDRADQDYRNFVWRWAPYLAYRARWPLFADLGPEHDGRLLYVQKMFTDSSPKGGYGWLVDRDVFVDGVINGWGLNPATPPFGHAWRPQPVTAAPYKPPAQGSIEAQQAQPAPDAITLNWRDAAHWNNGRRRPCIHCGDPTWLIDTHGRPYHKGCMEEIVTEIAQQKAAAT